MDHMSHQELIAAVNRLLPSTSQRAISKALCVSRGTVATALDLENSGEHHIPLLKSMLDYLRGLVAGDVNDVIGESKNCEQDDICEDKLPVLRESAEVSDDCRSEEKASIVLYPGNTKNGEFDSNEKEDTQNLEKDDDHIDNALRSNDENVSVEFNSLNNVDDPSSGRKSVPPVLQESELLMIDGMTEKELMAFYQRRFGYDSGRGDSTLRPRTRRTHSTPTAANEDAAKDRSPHDNKLKVSSKKISSAQHSPPRCTPSAPTEASSTDQKLRIGAANPGTLRVLVVMERGRTEPGLIMSVSHGFFTVKLENGIAVKKRARDLKLYNDNENIEVVGAGNDDGISVDSSVKAMILSNSPKSTDLSVMTSPIVSPSAGELEKSSSPVSTNVLEEQRIPMEEEDVNIESTDVTNEDKLIETTSASSYNGSGKNRVSDKDPEFNGNDEECSNNGVNDNFHCKEDFLGKRVVINSEDLDMNGLIGVVTAYSGTTASIRVGRKTYRRPVNELCVSEDKSLVPIISGASSSKQRVRVGRRADASHRDGRPSPIIFGKDLINKKVSYLEDDGHHEIGLVLSSGHGFYSIKVGKKVIKKRASELVLFGDSQSIGSHPSHNPPSVRSTRNSSANGGSKTFTEGLPGGNGSTAAAAIASSTTRISSSGGATVHVSERRSDRITEVTSAAPPVIYNIGGGLACMRSDHLEFNDAGAFDWRRIEEERQLAQVTTQHDNFVNIPSDDQAATNREIDRGTTSEVNYEEMKESLQSTTKIFKKLMGEVYCEGDEHRLKRRRERARLRRQLNVRGNALRASYKRSLTCSSKQNEQPDIKRQRLGHDDAIVAMVAVADAIMMGEEWGNENEEQKMNEIRNDRMDIDNDTLDEVKHVDEDEYSDDEDIMDDDDGRDTDDDADHEVASLNVASLASTCSSTPDGGSVVHTLVTAKVLTPSLPDDLYDSNSNDPFMCMDPTAGGAAARARFRRDFDEQREISLHRCDDIGNRLVVSLVVPASNGAPNDIVKNEALPSPPINDTVSNPRPLMPTTQFRDVAIKPEAYGIKPVTSFKVLCQEQTPEDALVAALELIPTSSPSSMARTI